jgi:hypothetical protein
MRQAFFNLFFYKVRNLFYLLTSINVIAFGMLHQELYIENFTSRTLHQELYVKTVTLRLLR